MQPHGNSAGDDRVADIEFLKARQNQYGSRVLVIQTMPRIHSQPQFTGECGSLHKLVQFLVSSSTCGIGVSAGVKLDKVRPESSRRTDLRFLWIDE